MWRDHLRRDAQTARCEGQSTVAGPDALARKRGRREQVDVDPSQPAARKRVRLDEREHFVVLHHRRLRQMPEQPKDLASVPQRAARKLADDEWMTEHRLVQEQPGEL